MNDDIINDSIALWFAVV